MEPILLTDKTRLKEIYQLRVLAWEHSDYSKYINRQLYPNGLTDHLDNDGFHFIMQNDKNEIIGCNRFNILHDSNDLIEKEFYYKFRFPMTRPFGFFSRLVIHPDYRGLKLSSKFDQAVLNFSKQQGVSFSVVRVRFEGIKQLTKFGFQILDKANSKFYGNSEWHVSDI